MADYFIVRYSSDNGLTWTDVEDANNIYISNLRSAKSWATFSIGNPLNASSAAWKARVNYDVQIVNYNTVTEVEELVFQGVIQYPELGDPIIIHCKCLFEKMSWYGITEEANNTILDQYKVSVNPDVSDVFDFTSDTVGNDPADWTVTEAGSGAVQVETSYLTQNMVVSIQNNGTNTNTNGLNTPTFSGGYTLGNYIYDGDYLEFKFAYNHLDTDDSFVVRLSQAGTSKAILVMDDAGDMTVGGNAIDSFSPATWYTIKVVLNPTTEVFDIYVDGVLKYSYSNTFDFISKVYFHYYNTSASTSDSKIFIDDITPHRLGSNTIGVTDLEGGAVSLDDDYWNPADGRKYYALIADKTLEESTQELEHGTDGYVGYNESNTYSAGDHYCLKVNANNYTYVKNTVQASNYVELKSYYTTAATHTGQYLIYLDIGQYSIPTSAKLTKMNIKTTIKYGNDAGTIPDSVSFVIGKNTTKADLLLNVLKSFSSYGDSLLQVPGAALGTAVLSQSFEMDLDLSNEDRMKQIFDDSGANYEGGYIGFVQDSRVTTFPTACIQLLRWYYLEITIYYETKNFDQLNTLITDTISTNSIQVEENLYTKGVALTDTVVIAPDAQQCITNCFIGVNPVPPNLVYKVNNGDLIGKGFAKDGFGDTGFSFWESIMRSLRYYYFLDYSYNSPILTGLDVSDYTDGGALTGFTHNPNVVDDNEKYGYIILYYKNGVVCKSTGISSYRGLPIVSKEILEQVTAEEECTKLVTEYAEDHMSHTLKFNGFKSIKHGYTYSYTYNSITYSNEPLRRVDYKQSSRQSLTETTAYLGLGSTPNDEYIGQKIGKVRSDIEKEKRLSMVADYSGVTRHAQLLGVESIGGTGTKHLTLAGATYAENAGTYFLRKDGLATQNLLLKDNEATSLDIKEGSNSYLKFTTTDSGEKIVSSKELAMSSQKITGLAAAANNGDAVRYEQLDLQSKTFYFSGTATSSVVKVCDLESYYYGSGTYGTPFIEIWLTGNENAYTNGSIYHFLAYRSAASTWTLVTSDLGVVWGSTTGSLLLTIPSGDDLSIQRGGSADATYQLRIRAWRGNV